MREVIAWVCVGILLCYIGWMCNAKPVTNDSTAAIDSLNQRIVLRDSAYHSDSAKWAANASAQDEIIRSLTESKDEQTQALTNQIVKLTFQRNKYRTAVEGKDTASQLQACDEFIHLADSFYTKAVVYEMTIDSLLKAHAEQRTQDTTFIAALIKDRVEGQKQIVALQHFLEDSIAENLELRKALVRSKRGRWILAALSAGAGGFIGHQIK